MSTTRSFIPISQVHITDLEEDLLLKVLRSGQIAQGPQVQELEELFAGSAGTKHAVAVSSGTAALFLSMEALGLESGDEVITTPFTFVATLNAILAAGATARFADIGSDYTIDPESVTTLVNGNTKAIVPVHLYGCPADMEALEETAATNNLSIVEDAAQAVGASIGPKPVGSWGLGCFSLYATKNVTTGEGGVVTTNDAELADRIRLLRNQGMRDRYDYSIRGHNFRLTDLQAALGIPQMKKLQESTERRRENARFLTNGLREIHGLTLPEEPKGRFHVFHQYTISVDEEATFSRDTLAQSLRGAGIGTGVYYPRLVHDYPAFRNDRRVVRNHTPNAASATERVLSLPVYPQLDDSALERIVEAVRSATGS